MIFVSDLDILFLNFLTVASTCVFSLVEEETRLSTFHTTQGQFNI